MMYINANAITSGVLLASSLVALWLGFFFLRQPKRYNGLGKIMTMLFLSWGAHFFVIGVQVTYDVFFHSPLLQQAPMRLLSAFFVLIEFSALLRFYFYIRRIHG